MLIAQQLKKKNIAEYLLYMWQVEDLIRANGANLEQLKEVVWSGHTFSSLEEEQQLTEWYENIIEMMRTEGVMEKGHLQINKNVLIRLTDLHNALLASPQYPFYSGAYYKALPFIVELRSKGTAQEPELETCFDALYGVMLLRLQKKEISSNTQKAIGTIGNLLSMLANYYDKEEKGELKFE